jgi:malate permease and related proteins
VTETAFAALAIILAGAVARRAGVLGPAEGPTLVKVVIHLTLPALIFTILIRADLHGSLILVPVAGLLVHVVLLVVVWASVRLWGMEPPRAGAMLVATAIGNTGFFGLPLIAASGAGFSLPAAVMYDQLCTGVLTWTSTVAIATAWGRREASAELPLRSLGRSLLLPPNWALVAGLAVNLLGWDVPDIVQRPFDLLSAGTLPLTMLYAGIMIEFGGLGRLWREVGYAAVVKLGLATVVGIGAGRLLGLHGTVLNTVAIMAAMPTAMMSLVIGARSGLRADVLAGAVVVTTLLSTLTLPAWRAVLL